MLIEQKVSLMIPNHKLGALIADRDAQVQAQILTGFAQAQLLKCRGHFQPIISLGQLLSAETFVWLTRLQQETEKAQTYLKEAKK